MATFLFALAALATLALLALDIVVLRGLEPREGDPPLTTRPTAPRVGPARAGSVAALVLGVLGFPGTLAPVVLTVLAFQAHPVTTDGWVALLAVVVASLSMSAAIKSFRIAQLLGRVEDVGRRLLGASVIYLLVWAVLVLLLLLLARSAEGPVQLLVWSYVAILLVATTVVGVSTRDLVGATMRPRTF